MTMRPFQVFKQFLSVWTLFAVILAGSLRGDDNQGEYAFYTSPEGTSYVAVGLRGVQIPSTATNEVVFLVDTSASQFGQTRRDTLSTLAATIDNLSASTQIQILVMDVETESLTSGFVQKGSPELNSALIKLQRRVPLGATDMSRGLEIAKKAFAGRDTEARRAVVYFGNGRSMAKTVDTSVFETIVKDYYSARIPFNACAVGIGTNLGLIGALTNQTGGNLIDVSARIRQGLDQVTEQGEALARTKAQAENRKVAEVEREITVTIPNFTQFIGKQIADSITATIVWPYLDSYSFPADWEVYPKTLQPIRSDRETIVVGKTDAETLPTFTLKLKGATAGNEMDLAWNFSPNNEPGANAGNNFLTAVVSIAAKDNGLTMPIVGWESLALIQEGFIANVTEQINRADAAIKTGNRSQAMKILDNVLRIDPTNKTAKRLHITAEKSIEGEPAKIEEDDSEGEKTGASGVIYRPTRYVMETVVEEEVSGTTATASQTKTASKPSFVDAVTIEQSIASQKVQNEVKQTINDAVRRMNTDPEGADQNLRLTQAMVRDNTSLSPDERNAMLDRIGNTIRQVQNVQYQEELKRAEAEANDAAQRDRLVILHDLQERQDKAIQIFNRFNALMEAKEYKVATQVAGTAAEMLPESTTPFAAQRFAEMTSYIIEYAELRHRRHVGFLECLMQTERSFIPVPEEPPLTYIEPERWLLLSERRKERYAVSDLSQSGAAEKKISKALEKTMDIELDENMTFEDLFTIIKDKNPGINLDIDPKGAGAIGTTHSSPVVREPKKYNGLKLRSILRLILRDQDLTYCVKDEVLLITSEEEAKKYMSVKVYPMADLVVPTTPIMGGMSGMSGNGGMMGGMSGGMGGMGGGMGGMMGGMSGGMGGMGGGMGMYSIPDEVRKDTPANAPIIAPKTPVNTPAKVSTDSGDLSIRAKQIVAKAKVVSDLSAFWDAFFAPKSNNNANVDEALVKEIARRLLDEMKAQKSAEYKAENQVVAFVESAILNDAMQPWMYEALAISLYRKNAPMPEVERAVLSAADFCDNPIDLMNVGVFMRSLGMKQKAFPLYKQALENLAPKQEFYSATLRLAQELKEEFNDEESFRWIALAILSQEWEGILGQKMTTNALDSLQNLEVKMQKAGRNEDAAKLAAEIKDARLRDCVITVEWTGNAGLDLMVREPTDSYCWNNNPRTLSGGLLKSIPIADSGKPITGTLTEQSGSKRISYVCPKGFNGSYGIVLRKDWGELTNNMVKISVDSNIVSGEKGREGTMVPMEPEGIIVCFDLETGRRTETLEEGELDVASLRMSVARQQLARNNALKRLKDDGLLGQVVGSNNDMGSGQGFNTAGTNNSSRSYSPYYGPGAVGYRPDLTWISDGVSLQSNAVVSADRRYVRISPSPQFSGIRSVYKYNTSSGDTGTSGGMGGMGGMSGGMGGMGGMSGGMGGMGGMSGGMGGMGGMGGY